ncbi:MAG: ABC transporter permease [Acidobacteriales bacterium]|nr:ABC transporter permease [Terriglobales bacterium]
MLWAVIFREVFRSLRRNRLRSVLTMLGIVAGVATFICVIGVGHAGTAKVEEQLVGLGDNLVWVEAGSRTRNGLRAGARGTRTLVLGDAMAILEQVPQIHRIAPNVLKTRCYFSREPDPVSLESVPKTQTELALSGRH